MTDRKKRPELLRLGSRGKRVRVVRMTHRGAPAVAVLWVQDGKRRCRLYGAGRADVADAKRFAEGVALELQAPPVPVAAPKLTVEQLWSRYFADVAPSLRPRSRTLYAYFWGLFARFAGPHKAAEDLTVETMTGLRRALEAEDMSVNTIRRVMAVARMAFRWAETHELIQRNRIGRYIYRVGKEAAPVSPDEFRRGEFERILATLDPTRGDQWRPWVALTLCGNQGARQNAVLHLAWDDVDLVAGTVTWRARWDKVGREWVQPLRAASLEALRVAARWREQRGSASRWVLPGHGRKEEDPCYQVPTLWAALKRAEARAGIAHRKGRGGHGLRRMLAGEVAAMTGDAKMALDAIGDQDLRQAPRYLKVRQDRLADAFRRLDAQTANPEQTGSDDAS